MKTFTAMIKKNILWLTFMVSLFVLNSCGPKVNTVKLTSKDLDTYETFAYLPNSNFEQNLEMGYGDESVGEWVINNVNKNMQELGYELDRTNPDLLVLIATETEIDTDVTRTPDYATFPDYYATTYRVSPYYDSYYVTDYYNYSDIIGYETDVTKYKSGTLKVSLVDRKTKEIIWSGRASDTILQEDNAIAIAGYVDEVFEEHPLAGK